MKHGVIYKITNPSGNVYIGQTCYYNQRMSRYKKLRCKDQPKLYNSFLKHGFENHIFEILLECPKHLLNEMEIRAIKEYNSMKKGLNCTEGGNAFSPSVETRRKIAIKSASRKHRPESIEKIRKSKLGNKGCLGRKYTAETIEKMRKNGRGKHQKQQKKVMGIDKNGIVYEFDSVTIAAEFTGRTHKSATNICAAIKGRLKTAFGYKWKYLD